MADPKGWDLPLEATSGVLHDIGDAVLAGGVVVMATVVDVPELGPHPGLVFRFTGPGGAMVQPVLLLLDQEHLRNASTLVAGAVDMAITAAERARRS